MDLGQAREALERAEALGAEMGRERRKGRWISACLAALGAVAAAATAALGFVPNGLAVMPVALTAVVACAMALSWSAVRAVVPRHYQLLCFSLGPVAGAACAVTVPLGFTVFRGEPLWWIAGALLTGLPFLVAAFANLRATGPRAAGRIGAEGAR
ncbi:hypothetical protein [Streptomonospora wellingtoniae]|uniref:Integral membrane protein n=1 Tax=Streptomonospora wellingtoniae TaxID=3075544 RepID=A0ABU2KWJ4_9ACTN|nr:hypothetical protein [Streptomonospora sp. DSM 45055]MDT0303478.1 hypothetical protein [Streptomonospora sp. DSM 45055]